MLLIICACLVKSLFPHRWKKMMCIDRESLFLSKKVFLTLSQCGFIFCSVTLYLAIAQVTLFFTSLHNYFFTFNFTAETDI